jgi:hypothetical protein
MNLTIVAGLQRSSMLTTASGKMQVPVRTTTTLAARTFVKSRERPLGCPSLYHCKHGPAIPDLRELYVRGPS